MIHDNRDDPDWSNDIEDWEAAFETGDVVIGPGHGSFKTMVMVHEINLNLVEYVTHRGVFWEAEEAKRHAEDLHDRAPLEQPRVPEKQEKGTQHR